MKSIYRSLLIVFLLVSSLSAQIGGRTDLGLQGCPISSITSSTDATVIVAGCESPFGLHYSTDGGENWQFAEGGSYTSGPVLYVAATANGFYVTTESGIMKASAPSSGSWSPDWSLTSLLDNPNSGVRLYTSGQFLYLGQGSQIQVVNTADDSTVQSVDLPSNTSFISLAIAPNFVYLIAGELGTGNDRTLYRATRNSSTGEIGGTWTDISGAAAFPTDVFFWSVFAHPDTGLVYVGGRELGTNITDLMYVSSDDGSTFSSTGQQTVANAMCFSGTTHIMGPRVSTDGGASFTDLSQQQVGSDLNGDGRLEDGACWIDPTNSEIALLLTNDGMDRTENLSAADPTIVSASLGLTGTLVYSISRSNTNSARVALGTSGGVAISNNFTNDDPDFVFPICPGNDCVGRGNVVIDPDDDSFVYYGSGNIRKGTITTGGDTTTVSWVDFANKPSDFFNYTVFETTPTLPGKLIAGFSRSEGEINGGLYFYDTTTGERTSAADLEGIQINDFAAVTSSVLFVSSALSQEDTEGTDRGIYRSTDGGITFNKMSDSDLGDDLLISSFAYDSTRDVLYAAKEDSSGNGTIFRLEKAANGGTDWKAPQGSFDDGDGNDQNDSVSFTTLAVDEGIGTVYAGSGPDIWHSMDFGENWNLFFQGVEGESTQDLSVGRDDDSEAQNRKAGDVSIQASIWKTIVQAATSGLFELQEATPEGTRCRVKLPKKCKGKLSKAARCPMQVSLDNSISNEKLEGSFRMYRRKNPKKQWQAVGKILNTNSKGKKKAKLRVKSSNQYQARFNNYFCRSNAVKVKIQKKR